MTLALSLFVLFYILMLAVQQYRPWVALGGAGAFLLLGKLGVYDFTLADAARAVDFNVLLMMAGMMGTVFLFIQSKMPARLAEELIAHVPDVRWAVSVLALLALSGQLYLLNNAGVSAYFGWGLGDWLPGRFIRFYGITEWLGWLWPYATLIYVVFRVSRKEGAS